MFGLRLFFGEREKAKSAALDARWFSRYRKVGIFDDIAYFRRTPKLLKQKELFLSGESKKPEFFYEIPLEELRDRREKLKRFQDDLLTKERNDIVREIYADRIDELLVKIELLFAVSKRDDEKVFEFSQKLYGTPDREILKNAVSLLLGAAETREVPPGEFLQLLQEKTGALPGRKHFVRSAEQKKDLVKAEELQKIFEDKLHELGAPWRVKLSDRAAAIFLRYDKKTIYIPRNRRVSRSYVEGLLEHEIGVHLTRHLNGLKSPLRLLSSGLAGYLKGEEGMAAYFEWRKDPQYLPGVRNYIAVCLATGMVEKDLGFREVFEFLKEYFVLFQIPGNEAGGRAAEEYAWTRAYRVFRGTTGNGKNTCFTRDLMYFQGFKEIESLVKEESPEMERFFAGKYDPANQKHRDILDALGLSRRVF
ncbi:MAG TPA: tyrosine/phenylalanine carboxypeptidase domain-containing protein [Candidatus Paceibacterota bacterium]|nr:tyrosine/phenylalanine carboxypeptidase domain-containing protein [Candidatus Paceibacterota bacterium]